MKPIRILHILTALDRGGIETMLLNYHQNIDTDIFQFDYLLHREGEFAYSEKVRSLGGRIYSLPEYNPFNMNYIKGLDSFFKDHKEYKIVHSHLNCLSSIPLKYAKKNGIPVRIAHAHIIINDQSIKSIYKKMVRHTIPIYATDYCACSVEAGKWMFPSQKVVVIPNAIDLSRFFFDADKRKKFRNDLNIKNQFVFGTVGRFTKQKNHMFLIELMKQMPNETLLFIVGEGPLKQNYIQAINENNLTNRVFVLDPTDDVPSFLCGIDSFLFPSIYEGLGIAAVEAQTAGLRTICSEFVPKEVACSSGIAFLPLDSKVWVEEMGNNVCTQERVIEERVNPDENMYDIKTASIWLENYYKNLYLKA